MSDQSKTVSTPFSREVAKEVIAILEEKKKDFKFTIKIFTTDKLDIYFTYNNIEFFIFGDVGHDRIKDIKYDYMGKRTFISDFKNTEFKKYNGDSIKIFMYDSDVDINCVGKGFFDSKNKLVFMHPLKSEWSWMGMCDFYIDFDLISQKFILLLEKLYTLLQDKNYFLQHKGQIIEI